MSQCTDAAAGLSTTYYLRRRVHGQRDRPVVLPADNESVVLFVFSTDSKFGAVDGVTGHMW